MNNSFGKFHYNSSFRQSERFKDHSYLIQDQVEHIFDQRNHQNQIPLQKNQHKYYHRTQDQVINNLNFSIEDLLTKISKATADFQEPPKISKPQSKTEYPAVFKLSNLSASTEGTLNQERSDPCIGRYEPLTENVRRSEPHAQKAALQKNLRNNFGQKQNSLYQTLPPTRNQSRNELRSETYNHSKISARNIETPNTSFNFVPEHKFDFQTYQWNQNGSKNQIQHTKKADWGKNASTQNLPFTEIKQQNIPESQKSHSITDKEVTSVKNQNKFDDFENQWRKYEQKMNELKKQSKTEKFQNFSFKNILHEDNSFGHLSNNLVVPQKKEFTSQNQININIDHNDKWNHSARSSPKKQLKCLLNQDQTSGFGYNPIRSKQYKKSITLNETSTYQPIPVSEDKKVNSLFDGKRIREVAASRIIDSPVQQKQRTINTPFNEILTQSNKSGQSKHQPLNDMPNIKINTVQKSQIITHNLFNDQKKLTIQDFILGKELGSGKFGDVYQALHKATGMLFAIKKIFKSTIMEYDMIDQFTRELKIHYTLNYPNIIKLYTHFDDEYHVFLVMEYGEGGMLMEKIKNGEKFSSIIVEQMLRAVEYLHSKKIAHRDIKPENIVLMFGDTAKLCDFGWSRVFDSEMKKTFCGTLDYVSPQMKDKGVYSLKIDIWSLGVLTFELLCGYAPFRDEITNWKKKGGNMSKAWNWNITYPTSISSVAQSFMRNLLKQNPQQRANIRFCLNHLFIRKYNEMSFNKDQQRVFRQVSMILKGD